MPVSPIIGLAAAALLGAPPARPACPPPAPQLIEAEAARPYRLDKLPSASLYLALDRRIDSCPAPIIIRSSIGK